MGSTVKGDGSPRSQGLLPFTGAIRLWSTMKERGFFTALMTFPVAFFRMFKAFKSLCNLWLSGHVRMSGM
ncbi:hypothetical protein [Metallosphaera hakonensis]|uniref:hypothetical protein n=1 Tax=Metallosphaera hakonensis TaxID=79601 RepID=UPI001442F343|nr:hypothetical protein [Metallosphaera hakonensis]